MKKYEINGTIKVAAENEKEARSRYNEEQLAGPIKSIKECGTMNLMERKSIILWGTLAAAKAKWENTEWLVSSLLQGLRSDDGIPETGDVELIVCTFEPETLKEFYHGCCGIAARFLSAKAIRELGEELKKVA